MTSKRRYSEDDEQRKRKKSLQNNSLISETSQLTQMSVTPTVSCGLLKKVILKNFMCHDAMECELYPHVNLIQGRNGSGKSAILTAIVVALGGSTRVTNRGSSIKDLVKYNKNTAKVEIHLNNEGVNSYKPQEYGDTIIIERKISSAGNSAYTIKSSRGSIISTKKLELQNILDTFNIQVDNPVTVLNQDSSRSFLKSSNPKDLFKFFMLATQLQQVHDIYSDSSDALSFSKTIVQNRSETLPQLERDMEEAKKKYELISTFGEKQKKVSELRKELAWSEIIVLEKDLELKRTKGLKFTKHLEKFDHELATVKEKIEQDEATFNDLQKQIAEIDTEMKAQDSIVLQKQKDRQEISRGNRELLDQKKTLERDCRRLLNENKTLEAAINNDHSRENYEKQKKENEAAILKIEERISMLNGEIEAAHTHGDHIKHTITCLKQDMQQYSFEERDLSSKCGQLERELKQLQGNKDPSMLYGPWVKAVLAGIQRCYQQGRFKEKPIGPLGMYIEVKDPNWAHIAERVIGVNIKTFLVSCSQDNKVLAEIFNQHLPRGERRPPIIIFKFRKQVHDVSRFETKDQNYSSLWSILDVKEIAVANALLDLMQVESILLVPQAEDAGQLLMNKYTVPRNCKCAYTLNGDQYYPDPNYRVYSGRGKQNANFLQVSVEERVEMLKRNHSTYQTDINTIHRSLQSKKQELVKFNKELSANQAKQDKIKKDLSALRKNLAEFQSAEIAPPPDVSQLTEELMTQETQLQQSQTELEETTKKCLEISTEIKKTEQYLLDEKKKKKNLDDKFNSQRNQIQNLQDMLKYYQEECVKIEKKKGIINTQKDNYDSELSIKEKEIQDKINLATKLSERIDTERNVAEITRQLLALQERLKQQEKSQGDLTDAAKNYQERKRHYLRVKQEIEVHSEVIRKLKEAIKIRTKRYKLFLNYNEIFLTTCFKDNLKHRNIEGYLKINYKEQTLTIGMKKQGNSGSQASAYQDLAMSSGGERSFATVSFILALWDIIDSPFRILDEFDVFMDCVARQQSMDLMLKSAKQYTQYIYLTPLDVPNTNEEIHTFVMPDPERNGNRT